MSRFLFWPNHHPHLYMPWGGAPYLWDTLVFGFAAHDPSGREDAARHHPAGKDALPLRSTTITNPKKTNGNVILSETFAQVFQAYTECSTEIRESSATWSQS